MISRNTLSLGRITGAVFLAGALVTTGVESVSAQSGNPFGPLAGSWRGGGTLSPLGGDAERVTCRASYKVSGSKLVQNIDCAATDYRFQVVTDLTYADGSLSGTWNVKNYNAGGGAVGRVSDDIVYVRISGEKFNGRMSINFSGSRQTVKIFEFHSGSGEYRNVANLDLRR